MEKKVLYCLLILSVPVMLLACHRISVLSEENNSLYQKLEQVKQNEGVPVMDLSKLPDGWYENLTTLAVLPGYVLVKRPDGQPICIRAGYWEVPKTFIWQNGQLAQPEK